MTFIVFAAILMALVVLCLLWPLLSRKERPAPAARAQANIEVFSHQLLELEQDLEQGAITDVQFQEYRLELEAQALEEIDEPAETGQPARRNSPYLAVALALFIPLLSLSIYSRIGSDGFAGARDAARPADSGPQAEPDLETALAALEWKVRDNPDGVEARVALGHVYAELGRYADAAAVYEELLRLRPREADVMVNYAEALARSGGNRFTGKPAEVLKQALEMAPDHGRALWLAGISELQANNKEQAAIHWRRLLQGIPDDSEVYKQVEKMLAEVEADPGSTGTGLEPVPGGDGSEKGTDFKSVPGGNKPVPSADKPAPGGD